MKRHIGKILNTGSRCVVVFMQIPSREDHALILTIDNLPDRIEQAVMDIVDSSEGQGDPVLANVLNRRFMPDMGSQTVLMALHNLGLLVAVPVDNVVMLPQPNMPFPLRDLLMQMGRNVPDTMQSKPEIDNAADVRYNPYDTAQIDVSDDNKAKAKLKILEAQLLQDEANKKLEEAYRFDPSLRPGAAVTKKEAPPKVDAATVVAAAETTAISVKKPRKTYRKKEKSE